MDRGRWFTFLSLVVFLFLGPLALLLILPIIQSVAPGRFWPFWVAIGIGTGPLVSALYFKILWPKGYPDVLVMMGMTWWGVLLFLLFQEEILGGRLSG